MEEDCYVKVNNDWVEAEFMGVYQYSTVVNESPMIGGHRGGVIAYPIALVKMDEKFKEFKPSDVLFNK